MIRLLTDAKARHLKPGEKPLSVGAISGLSLHPSKKVGAGKFILRFVSPETGKRRDMGLGPYPNIGIAQARKLAFSARELIDSGVDPIEQRKREKGAQARDREIVTFEVAAQRVYDDLAPGFKNQKHSAQWITTLKTYAFPTIGKRRVDQLTTANFADLLKPIWLNKPETASRVRQRCERVMTWCLAHKLSPSNPVSAVDALLPKQKKKRDRVAHFPSVPWRDLPSVCDQLFNAQRQSVGRQALLFLILTAARSGEVRGATWDEIDLKNQVWSIPADRMKAGVQHRVPLSKQGIELLKDRAPFRDDSPWIFSNSGRAPISDMTLTKILRDNNIASDVPQRTATAHGFRSSFRDWASERRYARDLAERALAHTIKSATEAAYHRTDLLEKRRAMMTEWAVYVLMQRR